MIVKWREEFSFDIDELDDQHKRIFDIAARIFSIARTKPYVDRQDELKSIIKSLFDYTSEHFSYEEELMKESCYTGFEEHKKEHDNFLIGLKKFEAEHLDLSQSESICNLIIFVTEWISKHIMKSDMKYKNFSIAKIEK